jgi:hypothetical protein
LTAAFPTSGNITVIAGRVDLIAELQGGEAHASRFQLIQRGLTAAVNSCGLSSDNGTSVQVCFFLAVEPVWEDDHNAADAVVKSSSEDGPAARPGTG